MRYTENAFDLAELELRARQDKAEEEHQRRLMEISEKAPEIYRMYSESIRLNYALLGNIGKGRSGSDISKKIAEIKDKNITLRRTMHEMLKACGYPEDYLQMHYQCEVCRDSGYHDGVRCECMKKLLKKYTTEEINSHCSIELHDFADFRPEYYSDIPVNGEIPREKMLSIFENCKNYALHFEADTSSMIFYGKTGLGKTFLSSCIAKELIDQGWNVVYGSLLKLMRQVEDERFNRTTGDTMSIMLESDLLILDDLGSEFQTQFTDSVLYELINERINERRPIIISTNLSIKELNKKYNDRIVSRITGCFRPSFFVGNDVRLVKLRNGIK